MIFDGENLFFNKKPLSSGTLESDIVNVGPGETYQPMFLAVFVHDPEGDGKVTVKLETAATEDFAEPKTLGTYDGAGSQPVPRGNLGYLRVSVESTYTGGELTAGLVVDDDIKHRE